jgi:hypothetical protein
MSNTIKIPDSPEAALEQLGRVGRRMDTLTKIMTARKWERAAIIAALVGPGVGHGPGRGLQKAVQLQAFPYTVTALAALGIHGLRSNKTIANYRDAWFRDGREAPDLGDVVDLSNLPEWTGVWPERPLKPTGTSGAAPKEPERVPEPGDPDYDTEAAAVRAAERAGTVSIRDAKQDEDEKDLGPAQTDDVVVFMRNYDAAHLNIDRARSLMRDARRSRDEDYPQLNDYHKQGIKGALTEMRRLIEELDPYPKGNDPSIASVTEEGRQKA